MKLGKFRSDEHRVEFAVAYEAALRAMVPPSLTTDVETTFGTVRTYTWQGEPAIPPVLLVPGMRAGAPMWAENLPDLLASGRTIIAVDALGDAGMSVQTTPIRSPHDQARWLDEALESLSVSRVHSMGHSFGGATAAGHAARFPRRVASLALLEPVFTLRWPPPATFAWATIATLPLPGAWQDHALAALGGVTVEEVRTPSPIGTLIAAATRTFTSALPTPRPLSNQQLAALLMPTYVAIASHHSLAGGVSAATRADAHLPEAVVEIWPNTTHSLPMQAREPLAARLRAFWKSADERTREVGRKA